MNPNPAAVRILCFGDSNTWGQKPDKSGRFLVDRRWTGLLQALLGEGYEVIEEGLGGRTTDVDYENKPGKNGRSYLLPCLASQSPVDLLILMLGTNDLKTEFQRSAEEVAQAVSGLVTLTKSASKASTNAPIALLLLSPAVIDPTALHFKVLNGGSFDETSVQKSRELPQVIQQVAMYHDCIFFDVNTVASVGEDGLHLDLEAHMVLAEALCLQVRRVFASSHGA